MDPGLRPRWTQAPRPMQPTKNWSTETNSLNAIQDPNADNSRVVITSVEVSRCQRRFVLRFVLTILAVYKFVCRLCMYANSCV